jgi:hypothetical protein
MYILASIAANSSGFFWELKQHRKREESQSGYTLDNKERLPNKNIEILV